MPQCTSNIYKRTRSSKFFVSRAPTKFRYKEKFVFFPDIVRAQSDWIFEFDLKNQIGVPNNVMVGSQEKSGEKTEKIIEKVELMFSPECLVLALSRIIGLENALMLA